MDFDDAFASDVTPGEFFAEMLPDLHRERLDTFERFCETTLRFSIRLTDVGEQYSVELTPEGARSREGEFIDFPVVTIEGTTDPWETIRRHTRRAFEKGEEALEKHPPPDRIDDAFLADFETFDGVFEVDIDLPDLDEPAEFRIILNDYQAPPDAPTLRAEIGPDAFRDLLQGRRSAEEVAQSVGVSGDMSLAFELGGILLQHFPELED